MVNAPALLLADESTSRIKQSQRSEHNERIRWRCRASAREETGVGEAHLLHREKIITEIRFVLGNEWLNRMSEDGDIAVELFDGLLRVLDLGLPCRVGTRLGIFRGETFLHALNEQIEIETTLGTETVKISSVLTRVEERTCRDYRPEDR